MSPYLKTHSPSPTTISYIVSSKRRGTSRLFPVFNYGIRAIIVFYAIVINLVKAEVEFGSGEITPYLTPLLKPSLIGNLIRRLAGSTESWLLLTLSLVVIYLCLRRNYTEESLLVLQGLGIQTSTSSSYFLLSSTTTFIPTTQIQDIVIHEAFIGLEVRFYLAVIVEGATEVVVVFPRILPRRDILEEVWRGARKCLYAGSS